MKIVKTNPDEAIIPALPSHHSVHLDECKPRSDSNNPVIRTLSAAQPQQAPILQSTLMNSNIPVKPNTRIQLTQDQFNLNAKSFIEIGIHNTNNTVDLNQSK